jgi:hypothetical protein
MAESYCRVEKVTAIKRNIAAAAGVSNNNNNENSNVAIPGNPSSPDHH